MAGTPTFALPPTFLGTAQRTAQPGPCVVGVPFDGGTTNRSGARSGPAAIRTVVPGMSESCFAAWAAASSGETASVNTSAGPAGSSGQKGTRCDLGMATPR